MSFITNSAATVSQWKFALYLVFITQVSVSGIVLANQPTRDQAPRNVSTEIKTDLKSEQNVPIISETDVLHPALN